MRVCVCVRVRVHVRVCMCVCVCVRTWRLSFGVVSFLLIIYYLNLTKKAKMLNSFRLLAQTVSRSSLGGVQLAGQW